MGQNSIKLKEVVERLGLQPVRLSEDFETKELIDPNVNRPGLQLTGFYSFFNRHRVQLIGKIETAYLSQFSTMVVRDKFEDLMSKHIPAVVVCHEMGVRSECLEMAERYDINVFRTDRDTSETYAAMQSILRESLAPSITRHGVFVEIYGEGVLILGDSGVGKSEAAIELIKRGHRLIADDAVEIKRISADALVGSSPELIRYYIELRGIGVIDVRQIFGTGAVKMSDRIELVVTLENWEEGKPYNRLGGDEQYMDILGVKIPCMTIPVRPGRNLAVILEVAAMNNRHKKMGYNTAEELIRRMDSHFDNNFGEIE
ncbi:MAG: HPr(Ser) kinase/phosphatase [Oscillospiraceae bacterium]|nr:HPr(Ser) kinase/phosphatase [Oscillospiraceae bacterium]